MDIGFIHDTPTPSAEDSAIAAELGNRGHAVTMIDASTTPPPAGYDVFIFSESAAAFQVADWTDTSTPMLCWETAWDTIGIATVGASSQGADNTWDLAAHEITTGLPNPATVLNAGAPANYCVTPANLVADAVAVATAGTGATLAVLESGDLRFDSTPAPARRACMALTNSAAGDLAVDGYDLIENALTWLSGGTASGPAAGSAVGSFNFEGNATGTGGTPTRPVPVGGFRATDGLAADLVLDAPKGVQAGDVQFAYIVCAADDEPITDVPAGWTELGTLINPLFGGLGTTWAGLYVSTTDTGPATFHRDFVTGSRAMFGVRVAYRHASGYTSATLANTGTTSASTTTHPIPAVTAPDGGAVFAALATEATLATTFTPPPGFTERFDRTAFYGGAIDDIMSLTVADIESDGTATSGDFLSSSTCHAITASVALAPVAQPAAGSATGTFAWSGTASGSRPSQGRATGSYAISGSATGTSPAVAEAHGSATGTFSVAGQASGHTEHHGSAVGTWAWTGRASGPSDHRDIVIHQITEPVTGWDPGTPSTPWVNTEPVNTWAQAAPGNGWSGTEPTADDWPTTEPDDATWDTAEAPTPWATSEPTI